MLCDFHVVAWEGGGERGVQRRVEACSERVDSIDFTESLTHWFSGSKSGRADGENENLCLLSLRKLQVELAT